MIQTTIIYLISILLCFAVARHSRITSNPKYLIIIIIILSLVAGLRNKSVGIDTIGYVDRFELIQKGYFDYVWGVEVSFKYFMLVVSKVTNSYTGFLVCCAIITNACIVLRLWDYNRIINYEWAIVAYFAVFYFYSFNIIRQMCAVAIVFLGSRFIAKRKYWLFLLFVLLAFIFHTTALLSVILLFFEFFNWKYLAKSEKYVLIGSVMLLPVSIYYLIQVIDFEKYSYVFDFATVNIGVVLFAKTIFVILSSKGLKKSIVAKEGRDIGGIDTNYLVSSFEIYYYFGLIICYLGYFFRFANRLSLYFYLFECVYMAAVMKDRKSTSVFSLFPPLLYLLIIISDITNGGQGQVPYSFFWQ